jgi:hypothetical protein
MVSIYVNFQGQPLSVRVAVDHASVATGDPLVCLYLNDVDEREKTCLSMTRLQFTVLASEMAMAAATGLPASLRWPVTQAAAAEGHQEGPGPS